VAANRRAVLELLSSIADSSPVNWQDVESRTAPADAEVLEALRVIAGVAEVHRTHGGLAPVGGVATTSALASRRSRLINTSVTEGARWGGLEIRGKLGEGSFAEVFLAYDPRLQRQVALKLLKHGAARAMAEARALARVEHECVVRVYGAEVHNGRMGLWMELVEGRTLETILRERGQFGARESSLIGQDLCRALAAVHQAGLTHGDVKAQNVMREEGGRTVLMDFGAGRRNEDRSVRPVTGTPIYMAPELLANDGLPTVASDIYSLGVLLFHIVTARFPFEGASVEALQMAQSQGESIRLHDLRPGLPDGFVRVVERALALDPNDRFRTAGEAQAALASVLGIKGPAPSVPLRATYRRLWRWAMIPAALALTAILSLVWRWPVAPSTPAPASQSIAVLPFRDIGADAGAAYYSEGLSDDITAQLARLASVRVVSGISVRRYRNTDRSASEIGRDLNVRRLVTGSVRLSGDRLRVVVEVVDCATSEQLWAGTFERPRADVMIIQASIIQDVAKALKGALSAQDARRLERRPIEYRAFELYLQGRYYWNLRTPDGLRTSIDYFTQARQIDDRSALPDTGLADAHMLAAFYHLERPAIAHAEAEAAAVRAIQLEPDLAEAHAALGSVRLDQFRWEEARLSLTRAIELNPSYASAHHWYALWLVEHGRFEEALAEIRDARVADPFSQALAAAEAYIRHVARSYDAALNAYQNVLRLDPTNFQALEGIVEAHAARGSVPDALRALTNAQQVSGRPEDLRVLAAYVYALARDGRQARQLLTQAEAAQPENQCDIAAVYAALGDADRAFEWLDRAVHEHDAMLGYLRVDPKFDPLRDDSRFAVILGRIGMNTDWKGQR